MRRNLALLALLSLLLTGCAPAGRPAAELPPETPPAPPQITDAPNVPEIPEIPEEPETPDSPETPDVPEEPDRVGELMAAMSLEDKLWQLIVAAPEDLAGGGTVTSPGDIAGVLSENTVGGLVLFRKNVVSRQQVTALLAGAQEAAKIPLFTCVDEEGGSVSRISGLPDVMRFGPMYDYRDQGPDGARRNAAVIGEDIRSLGFNLDFAPVADVWSNPENTVIGRRAYSGDPEEASELVAAAVEGFHSAGVLCCLKHFPGHGDTAADSHTGQAVVELTEAEIRAVQLPPFSAGIRAGADLVMVGHLTVPALSQQTATVSRQIVTGLLREELGFQGVIITDSLKMAAVTGLYETGELAVRCVEAGCDMLLMPASPYKAVSALRDAVDSGRLSVERIDESVRRILELKRGLGIIE